MLIDARRELIVPGDHNVTIAFCANHFVKAAEKAIQDHGAFFVALSGGSTPKLLFERLSAPPYNTQIDWTQVHLFWSDERSAPASDPESNYHMAMEAGLKNMPIPKNQIHRMCAETSIQENALSYEQTIKKELQGRPFDLLMLGLGEDGHTASLFPNTEALKEESRFVVGNFVPQKDTWRMTFTFPYLNQNSAIVFYVMGSSKKEILAQVLSKESALPAWRVGTPFHPALFIADEAAASSLRY